MRRRSLLQLVLTAAVFLFTEASLASEALRSELDAVRQDLEALRVERALAALETIAARADLSDEDRVQVLGLRAQAHVVSGKLDLAEADFREILRLDPDYAPDPRVFPPKALARHTRARDAVTGTLRLRTNPEDALVVVDEREREPSPGGAIRLAAGEHRLRVARRGYDAAEVPFRIVPGEETLLEIHLDPNSRSIVVRTELEGVEVRLDGNLAGLTARPEAAADPTAVAELTIEDVPLGEHVLTLAKTCYRTETVRALVAADLASRSPLVLDLVRQVPSSAQLLLSGLPTGATVLLDGKPVEASASDPIPFCPGDHEVEVRAEGRAVYWRRVSLAQDESLELAVEPGPMVVLVGTDTWPREIRALAESGVILRGSLPRPGAADLRTLEGWQGLQLPADTDLALALLGPEEGDLGATAWLYSPLLKKVEKLSAAGKEHARPSWLACDPGMRVADSRIGGPARVVEVRPGGPAAVAGIRPGDRVLSVAGATADTGAHLAAALAAGRPGAAVEVEVQGAAGPPARKVRISCSASPVLLPPSGAPGAAAVRAAWASVDAAASPPAAQAALANLALALESAGRYEAAAETWRRVRFGERAGVGEGTVAYYLARALEAARDEKKARELFERAARSRSTAFADWGPEIAPAAADHARDLGLP